MKGCKNYISVTFCMLLCVQLFNVCLYVPTWMHPGKAKADLTETVLELVVEGFTYNSHMMYAYMGEDGSNSATLNEETLEDLHPPESKDIDFTLRAFSMVQHNYYHFTPDVKYRVLSVVTPPPDFC